MCSTCVQYILDISEGDLKIILKFLIEFPFLKEVYKAKSLKAKGFSGMTYWAIEHLPVPFGAP